MLEMPTAVDFPDTPVKQESTHSFMMTNTGNREARYVLICQAPFAAFPTEGLLGVGATTRCKMTFKPQLAGAISPPLSTSFLHLKHSSQVQWLVRALRIV